MSILFVSAGRIDRPIRWCQRQRASPEHFNTIGSWRDATTNHRQVLSLYRSQKCVASPGPSIVDRLSLVLRCSFSGCFVSSGDRYTALRADRWSSEFLIASDCFFAHYLNPRFFFQACVEQLLVAWLCWVLCSRWLPRGVLLAALFTTTHKSVGLGGWLLRGAYHGSAHGPSINLPLSVLPVAQLLLGSLLANWIAPWRTLKGRGFDARTSSFASLQICVVPETVQPLVTKDSSSILPWDFLN